MNRLISLTRTTRHAAEVKYMGSDTTKYGVKIAKPMETSKQNATVPIDPSLT
jgi:hypothetical protein